MQLNNRRYFALIDKILLLFSDSFGKDLILVEKQEAFEHMGFFKIQYKYLPLEYDIIFENGRGVFTIDIFDDEGAMNTLYRLEDFNNETKIENVEYAIQKLKNVLIKNDFCFYITRGKKLYRKEGKQYKRVKDLAELISRR